MPYLTTTIRVYFADLDTLEAGITETMPFTDEEKQTLLADHSVIIDPSKTGEPVSEDTVIKVTIEED